MRMFEVSMYVWRVNDEEPMSRPEKERVTVTVTAENHAKAKAAALAQIRKLGLEVKENPFAGMRVWQIPEGEEDK